MKTIRILLVTAILGFLSPAFANNIQITSVPCLSNWDEVEHTVDLVFSMRWDNSWKTNFPNNWDAAWVFAKYREGAGDWLHMYIDTSSASHKVKANADALVKVGTSQVTTIVDGDNYTQTRGLGAFLYRKDNGKGDFIFDSIALKWKYADQGLDDGCIVSLRVFAIEMVYVPQGPYEPGDRTATNAALSSFGNSGDLYTGGNPFRERNPAQPTTSIFKELGTVTYPTGATGTIGNGSNGAPAGWYKERNSNGAEVWRSSATSWNSVFMALAANPAIYSGGNAFYDQTFGTITTGNGPIGTGGTVLGTVKNIVIKMPAPFKATHAYFGGYNYHTALTHQTNRFMIRARKDTINWASYEDGKWVDLGGDLTTNLLASGSYVIGKKNYVLDPVLIDTFSYYEFRYTFHVKANGPIFDGLGISDESPGGFPENEYYYARQYAGAMPLKLVNNNLVSSPTYPNGYEAFYVMKYELSQHAYVDFLNTLSVPQQTSRVPAAVAPATGTESFFYASGSATLPTHPRCYVVMKTKKVGLPADYFCYQSNAREIKDYNLQGGNIAMPLMMWADNSAYLCWSGLRPLTELEYEKACKGPSTPFSGMYAWGTSTAVIHTGVSATGIYTGDEMVTPANANFICQGVNGIFPARVGCLATQTSTRTDAGASYYGILNLSDNVSEYYINISTKEGMAFSGEHGSGNLDGDGNAQVNTWPAPVSGLGAGFKGYLENSAAITTAQVADRRNVANIASYATTRYAWVGCRGGRTAPK